MKKIILTGFGSFGPYQFNPTKDLVEFYNGKKLFGAEIIGVVLPCEYYKSYEVLAEKIDKIKPNAIISTGLSSSVFRMRIERTFRNLMDGKYPDNIGFEPKSEKIVSSFSDYEFLGSFADNIRLANTLHLNDISVGLSSNADYFFCNYLGYKTTMKIMIESLPIKNMFIHIPWTDDYKSKITLEPPKIFLKKETLHKAIDLLIEHI